MDILATFLLIQTISTGAGAKKFQMGTFQDTVNDKSANHNYFTPAKGWDGEQGCRQRSVSAQASVDPRVIHARANARRARGEG